MSKKSAAEKAAAAAAGDAPATRPAIQIPTRGRIIDFTDGEGMIGPAIVTQVQKGEPGREGEKGTPGTPTSMNVTFFHPVFGPGNQFIGDVDAAARDEAGEAGTWNWPVRG